MNLSGQVLVVEDEPAVRSLFCRVLEGLGCGVLHASDGPGALRAFRAAGPGVVVLDLHLPGLDGLSVAGEMLRLRPRTRIIVVTGDPDGELARRAMESGASDYLGKPVDLARLRESVAVNLLIAG
ncbi:MAG TPA: two-component system response regulator [Elusimicrobia bacterium]|nr:two-component system response regulator [Elusimicrobiota bacterium]